MQRTKEQLAGEINRKQKYEDLAPRSSQHKAFRAYGRRWHFPAPLQSSLLRDDWTETNKKVAKIRSKIDMYLKSVPKYSGKRPTRETVHQDPTTEQKTKKEETNGVLLTAETFLDSIKHQKKNKKQLTKKMTMRNGKRRLKSVQIHAIIWKVSFMLP